MNQNYQVVPAFMQDCMEQSIANAQDATGLEICSLLTFTCHSSFPTYFCKQWQENKDERNLNPL